MTTAGVTAHSSLLLQPQPETAPIAVTQLSLSDRNPAAENRNVQSHTPNNFETSITMCIPVTSLTFSGDITVTYGGGWRTSSSTVSNTQLMKYGTHSCIARNGDSLKITHVSGIANFTGTLNVRGDNVKGSISYVQGLYGTLKLEIDGRAIFA